MAYLQSFNKQAQVLRASTASADGVIIKIDTNMPAIPMMRKLFQFQSLRTTSIRSATNLNICCYQTRAK